MFADSSIIVFVIAILIQNAKAWQLKSGILASREIAKSPSTPEVAYQSKIVGPQISASIFPSQPQPLRTTKSLAPVITVTNNKTVTTSTPTNVTTSIRKSISKLPFHDSSRNVTISALSGKVWNKWADVTANHSIIRIATPVVLASTALNLGVKQVKRTSGKIVQNVWDSMTQRISRTISQTTVLDEYHFLMSPKDFIDAIERGDYPMTLQAEKAVDGVITPTYYVTQLSVLIVTMDLEHLDHLIVQLSELIATDHAAADIVRNFLSNLGADFSVAKLTDTLSELLDLAYQNESMRALYGGIEQIARLPHNFFLNLIYVLQDPVVQNSVSTLMNHHAEAGSDDRRQEFEEALTTLMARVKEFVHKPQFQSSAYFQIGVYAYDIWQQELFQNLIQYAADIYVIVSTGGFQNIVQQLLSCISFDDPQNPTMAGIRGFVW